MFLPFKSIRPDVGFIIVAMQFNNVVFPDPLGPIIPKNSPEKTSKLIPCIALVMLLFFP